MTSLASLKADESLPCCSDLSIRNLTGSVLKKTSQMSVVMKTGMSCRL